MSTNPYLHTTLPSLRRQCILILLLFTLSAAAQSAYDLGKPFGFATRSSRTDNAATYEVTGGGALTYPVTGVSDVVILTSDGGDMKLAIERAVMEHAVVILDGSKGDFLLSSKVELVDLSGKTILGINGARLCTQWHITPAMIDALNAAGVPGMSTSGGGGTLTNGKRVREQAEYNTRQILINLTGDSKENYRSAGAIGMLRCNNFVIRNISFVGPGSIDISGSDLLTFTTCKNMWVDHCDFTDGTDGNFDIGSASDFVTVSWCVFRYTARSYMHQNTNLVGSSDREPQGSLNVTFANNVWGENCRARMPMGRDGKIHMLNNYYDCKGNITACINPRIYSEFLIEGNYFAPGVKKVFSQSKAEAWIWGSNNVISEPSVKVPKSSGTVTVPYDYTVIPAEALPTELSKHAGATLFRRF
ncbi:MAG: hypothetical protein PUH57_05505 [Prevotellaceae bacterium]|nr:hypothetical protein [Prevotellaceae bacterium]MDY2749600.1 hypothetical protein [Prevotella sp.]